MPKSTDEKRLTEKLLELEEELRASHRRVDELTAEIKKVLVETRSAIANLDRAG
jgi:seryl-tRNA synthetase